MNEQQENYENQAMQDQLDRDPDYIAWDKAQESSIKEKDESLEALIKETEELDKCISVR